ncbi:glycosyltransferase family 4 protein [Pantoea sp. Eser]|nr:glycosyltransferase family 4 protein [Pantoea sp. Eser]
MPAHAGKKLATFHDLSPFKFPDYFEVKRCRYTQQEILKALKRSDYIITVSDFIRHEINQYFNYPLEKIQTTHLAASERFLQILQKRSEEQNLPVLKKYNLKHQQYALFVVTLEPRKNIISLINAYEKLPAQLRNVYPLVISGFKGWKNEDILKKIDKTARAGWLVYLGYVPRSDIPFLFSGARVFCFPGEYEGFGLPVSEALQSGVPVVCSATSSLPEVAGESSFYHDPKDVNHIPIQLETALSSDEHRYLAIQKGLLHAKSFDWEKCARQTVNVYNKLEML